MTIQHKREETPAPPFTLLQLWSWNTSNISSVKHTG